jgi:hypothetical protein
LEISQGDRDDGKVKNGKSCKLKIIQNWKPKAIQCNISRNLYGAALFSRKNRKKC